MTSARAPPPLARRGFQSPLPRGTTFNRGDRKALFGELLVSVPSSSGHDFQPRRPRPDHRRRRPFQSPLPRGTTFNPTPSSTPRAPSPMFQSPLPRGTTFNALVRLAELALVDGFSPLFLGARLSTMHGREPGCVP